MRSYPAKTFASVRQDKIDDHPIVPVLAPVFYFNWLSNVTRKKSSDVWPK